MLTIITCQVTDYQQNARIILDTETSSVCIIDPGGDSSSILACLDLSIHTIDSIYITHCHIDHAGGIQKLLAELQKRHLKPPKLYYHQLDAFLGANIKEYAKLSGLNPDNYDNVPKMDIDTSGIETFKIGKKEARQYHTPGHAPGHTVLYFPEERVQLDGQLLTIPILIAGDTLFKGSIGRTDLPGGNRQTLLTSIKTHLLTLPEQTLVLPGHGPNTTIAHEKKHNPFLI